MAVPLTAMKNNPEQENILAVQNKDCELESQDYPQFGHSHLGFRYSAWKNSKHVTLHYTVSCRGWKMTFTQRGGNCTQLHNSHFLSLHIAYRWLHFIEQNIYKCLTFHNNGSSFRPTCFDSWTLRSQKSLPMYNNNTDIHYKIYGPGHGFMDKCRLTKCVHIDLTLR